jgi:hypothetical protein
LVSPPSATVEQLGALDAMLVVAGPAISNPATPPSGRNARPFEKSSGAGTGEPGQLSAAFVTLSASRTRLTAARGGEPRRIAAVMVRVTGVVSSQVATR